ncbi:SDR family NAD(P)-dependent oxidoreductase [Cryptosporangium japonicum]|uniref:Uncharacterized protein n=1 Tax=Cryptosporangium japonicum TaxID=80872 RepID=A0ABP3E676_9ACTN
MGTQRRRLGDQVIVLVGAANAVGLTVAVRAAERGARLVLAADDDVALGGVVRAVRAHGGRATGVVADGCWDEDVARITATAGEYYDRVDTWVNTTPPPTLGAVGARTTTEELHRVFDPLYWGFVAASREAVRHFRRTGRGGTLINVGDFFAAGPAPGSATRRSAAAAVDRYTAGLRAELSADRVPVSVTLVRPRRRALGGGRVSREGLTHSPDAVAAAVLTAAVRPTAQVRVAAVGSPLRVWDRVVHGAPPVTPETSDATRRASGPEPFAGGELLPFGPRAGAHPGAPRWTGDPGS